MVEHKEGQHVVGEEGARKEEVAGDGRIEK